MFSSFGKTALQYISTVQRVKQSCCRDLYNKIVCTGKIDSLCCNSSLMAGSITDKESYRQISRTPNALERCLACSKCCGIWWYLCTSCVYLYVLYLKHMILCLCHILFAYGIHQTNQALWIIIWIWGDLLKSYVFTYILISYFSFALLLPK